MRQLAVRESWRRCYTREFPNIEKNQVIFYRIHSLRLNLRLIFLIFRQIRSFIQTSGYGSPHEYCPEYGWAALDPMADLLVVVVGPEALSWPNNALAINPDGSINHQIIAPKIVEQTIKHLPRAAPVLKSYPVDRGSGSLKWQNFNGPRFSI